MKTRPHLTALLVCCATLLAQPVLAQQVVAPEPLAEPATTLYRQVTPDGRVLYSDKPIKGTKVEETLDVDLPQDGSTWSAEGNKRPPAERVATPTPVKRVATIPKGSQRTLEEATAEMIRAEMLLEDARRKRDAGHVPLAAEQGRTGPGSAYAMRQQALARDVRQAEATLRQAEAERDAIRKQSARHMQQTQHTQR